MGVRMLTNQVADGWSSRLPWAGRNGSMNVSGALGGGTVRLVSRGADGTETTICTAASVGLVSFSAPYGSLYVSLSGSTTPAANVDVSESGMTSA